MRGREKEVIHLLARLLRWASLALSVDRKAAKVFWSKSFPFCSPKPTSTSGQATGVQGGGELLPIFIHASVAVEEADNTHFIGDYGSTTSQILDMLPAVLHQKKTNQTLPYSPSSTDTSGPGTRLESAVSLRKARDERDEQQP